MTFGSTVGNILSCYGDTTVRAVIVDNDCTCPPKGSIQYIRGLSGQKEVVLTFYIWKNPVIPLEDIMYVRVKLPEKLGKLPFKGHFPINVNNMEVPIDAGAIKSTVESIFSKNGFSLTSLDTNDPPNLTILDLFNEVRDHNVNDGSAGHTVNASPPDKYNFIHYKRVVLEYQTDIKTLAHRNYIIGMHIAHEFVHQMMETTAGYIRKIYPTSLKEDHCKSDRNLMFPGNSMEVTTPFLTPLERNLIQKSDHSGQSWYLLCVSGIFYPKGEKADFNLWERIPPSYKFVLSLGLLLYEIENKFGKNSPEHSCAAKIIGNRVQTIDLNSYDVK